MRIIEARICPCFKLNLMDSPISNKGFGIWSIIFVLLFADNLEVILIHGVREGCASFEVRILFDVSEHLFDHADGFLTLSFG